jgi:hypothetical protein
MLQFRVFPFTRFSKENPVPNNLDRNQDLSLPVSLSISHFSPATILCRLAHNVSCAVQCIGRSGRAPAPAKNNSFTYDGAVLPTHTQLFLLFLPSLISFLTSENDSLGRCNQTVVLSSLASKNSIIIILLPVRPSA